MVWIIGSNISIINNYYFMILTLSTWGSTHLSTTTHCGLDPNKAVTFPSTKRIIYIIEFLVIFISKVVIEDKIIHREMIFCNFIDDMWPRLIFISTAKYINKLIKIQTILTSLKKKKKRERQITNRFIQVFYFHKIFISI